MARQRAHLGGGVLFTVCEILLTHLAFAPFVLVMDGSVVGRGCTALMIHVIYKGRALPLAWRVRQGPKGHFPEALHIAVVDLIREVPPRGAQVVFLGDGEFDGTMLQRRCTRWAGRMRAVRPSTRWPCGRATPFVWRLWDRVASRATDCVTGGQSHPRRLWTSYGPVLLGQGGSRALVFGQ